MKRLLGVALVVLLTATAAQGDTFCTFKGAGGSLVLSNIACSAREVKAREDSPAVNSPEALKKLRKLGELIALGVQLRKTREQRNYLEYGPNWREKVR